MKTNRNSLRFLASLMCSLLVAGLLACGTGDENTQPAADDAYDGPLPNILDTICLSWRFTPGDSLVYDAVSFDSIVAFNSDPLLKVRRETWSLVCESVDENGRYHMRRRLEHFEGRESKGAEKDVRRDDSPWLGRTIAFTIDSLGDTRDYVVADTSAGMGPGGPFQPQFFVDLNESCKGLDEAWLLEQRIDTLYENGIPAPLRRGSYKYRIKGRIDTLGQRCVRFEYILSGQGSSATPPTHTPLLTTSVIAEFGSNVLRLDDMLPVALFRTSEIKLTVKTPSGRESRATHHINTDMRIREHFRHGEPVATFPAFSGVE